MHGMCETKQGGNRPTQFWRGELQGRVEPHLGQATGALVSNRRNKLSESHPYPPIVGTDPTTAIAPHPSQLEAMRARIWQEEISHARCCDKLEMNWASRWKRHFNHNNLSLEIVEIKHWLLEEKNSVAAKIAEGQSSEEANSLIIQHKRTSRWKVLQKVLQKGWEVWREEPEVWIVI